MRIAFIMLCHKNPEQINNLIEKLSGFSDADIYIHVDMNHAIIRDEIKRNDSVHLLEEKDSFYIQWGGIDIVKATLQLIRAVKESCKTYDYIWLLSGQDYPICPVKEIERRLEEKPGMNYIETILPDDYRYSWYKKLYEVAYPSWINKNAIPIKLIKRLIITITGGHRHTFSLFVRNKPFDFDFSFGSQWWTLTADAAYEILECSEKHPEYLEYFKKSIIPDECYFQTIFLKGSYMKQRSMNLTFINWGSNRRSPEILTINDIEKIRKASIEFSFARKMDLVLSKELITELETERIL